MKIQTIVLVLAAVVAFPALADLTNLSLSGTFEGWQSVGEQGNPVGLKDGAMSFTGGFYGSTTATGVDGYFYVHWETSQSVRSVRWFGGMSYTRTLTAFDLWSLNDGFEASSTSPDAWKFLGTYSPASNDLYYRQVVLTEAVDTKAIKLSYTKQNQPLSVEFETYSRDMTPLNAGWNITVLSASPALNGGAGGAFDGLMGSSYGSANLVDQTGFLELGLGGERTFGAVQIYFREQGSHYSAPEEFKLWAWDDDDKDYTVLLADVKGWGASATVFSLDLPTDVTTTKVYLEVTKARVVGNYSGGSFGVHEIFFYESIVPEPATMTLLALGGLSLLRRRRA